MQTYITGASGKLGQEVLKLIPDAIPLVRKTSNLKNEKIMDFTNKKELRPMLIDCNILIHLAGSMKFYDAKELYAGNVLLTKNLLSSIPKDAKVIYASSISVYGKNISGKVDEKTIPNPDSPYAKTKYEAENLVMNRKNSIALRLGPIYGPQYSDYVRFLKLIKKHRMAIFGNGKNLVSFIHVQDAAKAIKNAIKAKPGIYVISGESMPQEKIYEFAAKELGVPAPKARIPLGLAVFLARLEEKRASLTGRKPMITAEHINILGKSREFNCAKARKGFAFKPRKLEQGIKEIIKSAGF